MIQVQIEITKNPKKFYIMVNLLSREDATPEEYELAKAIEQLHLSVLTSTDAKVKVTQIEDKRHLTKFAADGGTDSAKSNKSNRKTGSV